MMIQRWRYRNSPSIADAPTSINPYRTSAARVTAFDSSLTALPTIHGLVSEKIADPTTHNPPRASDFLWRGR